VQANWDCIRASHAITEEGFKDAITEFISVYLDEEALTEQKLYISKAKKPYNMTVEEFHSRLKWVVLLMSYYPGADEAGEIYTDQDLKYIFKNAMPYPWQEIFMKSGWNLTLMSWTQIEHYFRGLRNSSDNKNGGNDRKRAVCDEGNNQDSSLQNGNGKRCNKWHNTKKNGKKQRNGNGWQQEGQRRMPLPRITASMGKMLWQSQFAKLQA
jgi:hypothetical protein